MGRPAAVLIALREDAEASLCTVLIRRRSDLRTHAGQLAFPGGRRELRDRTLVETALREAREEVALDPARTEVVGTLDEVHTRVSDFLVLPVVAVVEAAMTWRPQASEVAAVHEWRLIDLAAGRHGLDLRQLDGSTRSTPAFAVGENVVWGATARMLDQLLERLGPALAAEA